MMTAKETKLQILSSAISKWNLGADHMIHTKVKLSKKEADGYVIPLGKVNLVNVVTDVGMVGCGAFDVAALNNFGYPAAKVRPSQGNTIATIEDLLHGIVKEVNPVAEKLGLKVGISGREALELL
jgi:uncharacterized protein YunC (DUF1805 family)